MNQLLANRITLGVASRRSTAVVFPNSHFISLPDRCWFSTTGPEDEVEVVQTKRSRRRFRRIDEVPSYREFMHRQEVLGLYRQFLQAVRNLPDRRELSDQIRKEFSAMKNESDPWNRKRAIKEGQRRFKDLQTTVSTSVTFTSPATHNDLEKPKTAEDNTKVGTGWPWER